MCCVYCLRVLSQKAHHLSTPNNFPSVCDHVWHLCVSKSVTLASSVVDSWGSSVTIMSIIGSLLYDYHIDHVLHQRHPSNPANRNHCIMRRTYDGFFCTQNTRNWVVVDGDVLCCVYCLRVLSQKAHHLSTPNNFPYVCDHVWHHRETVDKWSQQFGFVLDINSEM